MKKFFLYVILLTSSLQGLAEVRPSQEDDLPRIHPLNSSTYKGTPLEKVPPRDADFCGYLKVMEQLNNADSGKFHNTVDEGVRKAISLVIESFNSKTLVEDNDVLRWTDFWYS